MKILTSCLAALLTYSCATLQPVIDVGKLCFNEAVTDTAHQIGPELEALLACSLADPSNIPGCALSGIANLATRWGEDALMCALAQIAGRRGAGPADSQQAVVSRRAAKLLAERQK